MLLPVAIHAAELPVQTLDSVLFLAKNTNNNQVHYGVKVDDRCRPLEKDTVYAYWRMLEEGPDERAGLMFWEHPGYGVRQPQQVHRGTDSGSLDLVIRGVPERTIELQTFTTNAGCGARAFTRIGAEKALLLRINIEVSGWANVHKVEIHGVSVAAGQTVSEITHQD
jgi:hypothetical protein